MADYDITIQQLFEAQVKAQPDALAVVCGDESLSFAELNARANSLAHRLRAEGVGPGAIVALMAERSFAMIVGILGIVKAGAAYLPLPVDNPLERTRYMLDDGGVQLVLVHGRTDGKFTFPGKLLNLDDAALYAGQTANPVLLNKPDDLVYVIYTSGSTGRPKGVMVEHRALVNRLRWMQSGYPIGPGDVVLQKTPYSFDVSVWELFWWALEGAALAFLVPGGERNPPAIVDAVRRHRVNVMHFVPSMLNVFLEYLDAKGPAALPALRSLRHVFASGEALTPSHVRKFNALFDDAGAPRLTNLYGPTEATVDVTYFDCPRGRDIDIVPIGRAIDNTRLYVIREGREAAIGETGELCIAGIGLARGYVNNAALTAQRFVDNPVNPGERIYRTGDLARWLPDGNLEYLGREDHQVKIRGLRVELGEIESTLREYPGVIDCLAAVERHSESVIILVGYVVSRAALDAGELKQYLRKRLPEYMVPHRFVRIAEMPLTASGKTDRKAVLGRA